jgi:hypothetical protein
VDGERGVGGLVVVMEFVVGVMCGIKDADAEVEGGGRGGGSSGWAAVRDGWKGRCIPGSVVQGLQVDRSMSTHTHTHTHTHTSVVQGLQVHMSMLT